MTTQKTTNDLHLVQESGTGKMFNTGDDKIQVLQLQGSWRDMGKQYGAFAKDGMQQLWDATVQPVFNEKWSTESEAEAECDHAEAVSDRMNSLRNDLSWIWTVADATPNGFSYECPQFDNRRRNPEGDTLAVVNTFMLDDWGIHRRETLSNSMRRYDNLLARLAEAHGRIDANKAMDIFDLPLFNEDGTFRENGGVTKPTKQDADLTDHQIVTRPSELEVWVKIPLQTQWRYVDLKMLFAG